MTNHPRRNWGISGNISVLPTRSTESGNVAGIPQQGEMTMKVKCIRTHDYKDASVEGWKCSACAAEFVYVGAPMYCPECGEEFEDVQRD